MMMNGDLLLPNFEGNLLNTRKVEQGKLGQKLVLESEATTEKTRTKTSHSNESDRMEGRKILKFSL